MAMAINYDERSVGELLDYIKGGLIAIPDFQRPGDAWDSKRVILLLDSILNNYYISSFFFAEGNLNLETSEFAKLPKPKPEQIKYWVLDGQQRLTSIYELFDEETEDNPLYERRRVYFMNILGKNGLMERLFKDVYRANDPSTIEEIKNKWPDTLRKELERRINEFTYWDEITQSLPRGTMKPQTFRIKILEKEQEGLIPTAYILDQDKFVKAGETFLEFYNLTHNQILAAESVLRSIADILSNKIKSYKIHYSYIVL